MRSRYRFQPCRGVRRATFGILAASVAALLGSAPAHANLVINPIWGSTITSDVTNGATIEATITQAINVYEAHFADAITVNIQFDEMGSGLGQSSTFFVQTDYTTYKTLLTADATTVDDATALLHLPTNSNPNNSGASTIDITTANWRALGGSVNMGGNPDSFIGINTSLTFNNHSSPVAGKYDLLSVVSHEIDEALAFGSSLNGRPNGGPNPSDDIWGMDLFRYDQNNNRTLSTSAATQAFFSIDGGTTHLSRFNQTAGGDFSDWYSITSHTPQVQDAFGTPGVALNLGPAELTGLDALGYTPVVSLVVSAPEPSSLALLAGFGGAASLFLRRRFRK